MDNGLDLTARRLRISLIIFGQTAPYNDKLSNVDLMIHFFLAIDDD